MKISAIIVTYNRLSLLKECIHKLLLQSYKLNSIYIINNNSSDGTTQFLNNIDNDIVKPINLHKNLGGAGGFSLGTKLAFELSDSDYFWLMDDDTIPTTSALANLVKYSKKLHGHFGYLCSNVRWWKNEMPSYLNVPIVSHDWNKYINEGLVKTISASFVSLLISRRVVKKIGLPIADMFIWGDDVEYTTRLSRKYESYFVPNSIVLHKSKSNSNSESIFNVSMNRLIYYKCMFRNRLYISRKYYKPRRTIKLIMSYTLRLLKIPFMSKDHKFKRFVFTLQGIINGLIFNPKIRYPKNK